MKIRLFIPIIYLIVMPLTGDVLADWDRGLTCDVESFDSHDVSLVRKPKMSKSPVPVRTAPGLRPPRPSAWDTDFILGAVESNLDPALPLETHAQPHLKTLIPTLLRRLPWFSLDSETIDIKYRNHLILQSQLLPGDGYSCSWRTGPVLLVTDAGRRLIQEFLQTLQSRVWRIVASKEKVCWAIALITLNIGC